VRLRPNKEVYGDLTKQIIIKGKAAKQIYDQILSKEKAMDIEFTGTEEKPVLAIKGY
jgi:hypothetical protein